MTQMPLESRFRDLDQPLVEQRLAGTLLFSGHQHNGLWIGSSEQSHRPHAMPFGAV